MNGEIIVDEANAFPSSKSEERRLLKKAQLKKAMLKKAYEQRDLSGFMLLCCSLIHSYLFIDTTNSAIAERPARRSVSVEMLFHCCTNYANKWPVSLKSTFSNCHVLFRYLHSFVHASFNYRTASMGYQCTTNRVDCQGVQV